MSRVWCDRCGDSGDAEGDSIRRKAMISLQREASECHAEGFALICSGGLQFKGLGKPNGMMQITFESNAGERHNGVGSQNNVNAEVSPPRDGFPLPEYGGSYSYHQVPQHLFSYGDTINLNSAGRRDCVKSQLCLLGL